MARLEHLISEACDGLSHVNADKIITETLKNLYDGVSINDVNTSMVITAPYHDRGGARTTPRSPLAC